MTNLPNSLTMWKQISTQKTDWKNLLDKYELLAKEKEEIIESKDADLQEFLTDLILELMTF